MLGKRGEIARGDLPSEGPWSAAMKQAASQLRSRNRFDLCVDSTGGHVATDTRHSDSEHPLLNVNRLAALERISKLLAVY